MRQRDEDTDPRRKRHVLLISLISCAVLAVGAFAADQITVGVLATLAGLAVVFVASRHARPDNWPPESTADDLER